MDAGCSRRTPCMGRDIHQISRDHFHHSEDPCSLTPIMEDPCGVGQPGLCKHLPPLRRGSTGVPSHTAARTADAPQQRRSCARFSAGSRRSQPHALPLGLPPKPQPQGLPVLMLEAGLQHTHPEPQAARRGPTHAVAHGTVTLYPKPRAPGSSQQGTHPRRCTWLQRQLGPARGPLQPGTARPGSWSGPAPR